MAPAKTSEAPHAIHFAGPPNRLQLLSAPALELDDVALEPGPRLAEAAHVDRTPLRLRRRRRDSSRSPLRIRLDRRTPPGDYEAVLRAGGKRYETRITVEPTPRLSASPAEISFVGAPGDEASANLLLINTGNVAIDIPKSGIVGVYDDDGIEAAFAHTYFVETDDATELIGHLLRKLREGHGGLLKMRIDGPKTLDGSASCLLSLHVGLGSRVKPGHTYHGVWSLEPLHISVGVTVRREARGASK